MEFLLILLFILMPYLMIRLIQWSGQVIEEGSVDK